MLGVEGYNKVDYNNYFLMVYFLFFCLEIDVKVKLSFIKNKKF